MSLEGAWWQRGAVYQVYLRSFQDSDGDGLGDLEGLRRRLPYLADLGVGSIWLSPIHPSPDADFGYDVADYDAVDPRYGDLDLFERVLAEAHALGLRVLLDGVFNHTSIQHRWFTERPDFYIWRDRPNNWKSTFGGPAWTRHGERFYLHSFAPEQPDLNWRNPELVDEVLASMERWFERGVDGFRLDVFNCYLKDAELRDNPRRWHPGALFYGYIGQHHLHDRDQPELAHALQRMRSLADRFDAVLVGETLDERFLYDNAAQWVGPERLHSAFHFRLLHSRWGARPFAQAIQAWTESLGGEGWPTWVLSNHDFPRAISRWGGREDRARLLALLQCSLRGTPFLYQGEELGQPEARLPRSQIVDTPGKRFWPFYRGRDGCRTPMRWNQEAHGGFSTGEPWLPLFGGVPASEQVQPTSVLQTWRRALALRAAHPELHSGGQRALRAEGSLLRWEREGLQVALNLGDRRVPLDHRGPLLFSTEDRSSMEGQLQPAEGVVYR